jgi:hypothetical protein
MADASKFALEPDEGSVPVLKVVFDDDHIQWYRYSDGLDDMTLIDDAAALAPM